MNGDPHRWALGKVGMMYSRHPQITVRTTPSSKTQVIVLSMDCHILHVTDGAGDLAHLLNKGAGRMLSHTPRSPLPIRSWMCFTLSSPYLRSTSLPKIGSLRSRSPRSFGGRYRATSRIRDSRSGPTPTVTRGPHSFKSRPAVRHCKPQSHSPASPRHAPPRPFNLTPLDQHVIRTCSAVPPHGRTTRAFS